MGLIYIFFNLFKTSLLNNRNIIYPRTSRFFKTSKGEANPMLSHGHDSFVLDTLQERE